MSAFASVIGLACFVSLAISFVDMICPEKKFEKQLKVIFSLVFVISIATPVVKGDIVLDFPEIDIVSADVSIEKERYDDEIVKQIKENVEKGLYNELLAKNLYTEEISVIVNISDNNSISISKVIFYTENSEMDEEIYSEIRKILGEETEIIRGQ
ncbi:MAG: stage III sporulation protein AF [Oscillospiraceae bacterium]|nr:stage III sporulation protein AF [Oscillospiraceae bacterium]